MSAVDWSIGSSTYGSDVAARNGPGVSDSFQYTNGFGYSIDTITVDLKQHPDLGRRQQSGSRQLLADVAERRRISGRPDLLG